MRNEVSIELSTDINVITAEINAYQRVAGEAIFEIGRRLKHVKENDLAHGEWERWVKEDARMSPGQARKFITVAEEFGTNRSTWNEIGIQALYLIATLPPEQREVEHVTEKGEVKKPEDMTVRELRELKKALKQAEQQAEAERRERERLEEENEQLAKEADKPPEVRTEYVEVPIRDESVEQRLQAYEERFGAIENYSDRPRATNLAEVTTSVMSFSKAVRDLAKRHAYLIQYQSTIEALDATTKREYNEAVQALYDLSKDFGAVNEDTTVIDVDYEII